jgi:DNA-binding NtrC family response regulator|tara:strand:- start:10011 stop:10412 length:402 start_codon:yes stop_codon:yes gene_type:complete
MPSFIGQLKGSILIVDDDPEALEEMADALEDFGLTVYTAVNEVIALELALKHRPDFVIMDYLLRGYTGVEAINEIHKVLPETKVIMISAFDDLSRVVTSTNSSVIAVLKKPLSIESIGRFISNQLDQKNQRPR